MKTKPTLTSMFESNKEVLVKKLSGLSLPKDAEEIQEVVSNCLNVMFDNNGEYRQNLTQAEDYILQAALSLLNAQQDMSRKLSEGIHIEKEAPQPEIEEIPVTSDSIHNYRNMNVDGGKTLLGVGGGAIVGKMILGSWGAVFGAIAGTALVLYMSAQSSRTSLSKCDLKKEPSAIKEDRSTPIDVNAFIAIVSRICESVDSLINTFRAQIQRVVDKYESQEKPTLEKEYGTLLESIQSLLGVAYTNQPDDKRLRKIDQRIEQLAESLENYELEVVSYSNETKNLFEELGSSNVTEPTMVCPAIIKNGNVVIRGKVFVKS